MTTKVVWKWTLLKSEIFAENRKERYEIRLQRSFSEDFRAHSTLIVFNQQRQLDQPSQGPDISCHNPALVFNFYDRYTKI